MHAASCPAPDVLMQLHGGAPDVARDNEVITHVSACPSCQEQLEEYSRADALMADLKQAIPAGVRWPQATPAGVGSEPTRIAGYRIVRRIGQGGMGVVYLAEQERPHREVALKLIHPRNLSPRALRRFELEVELLGRLEHPAIARIFEAGTSRTGDDEQPFFAMEYVRGNRLDEHLRQRVPDLVAQLRLFLAICEGVHHAHLRGVIHRDLKPGNILVDAEGRPKVIDFGLARVLDPGLLSVSFHSDAGGILGTLPYMAPEQLAGDPAAVDVRADIYSLGAILCEMLCGRLPLDLSMDALPHAMRRIESEVPVAPSVIRPGLPRELDWTVLKALEKAPDQRYPSVRDLAEDVRRFLADEPLLAGPPSTRHRMALFVRRHRLAVAAATACLLMLLIALAVSSYGLLKAQRSAADAQQQRAVADLNARIAAQRADDLFSLSAAKDLEDLKARAETLWPATSELIPAYEQWIVDGRALIAGRPADPSRGLKPRPSLEQHEARLAELRLRALPQNEKQRMADQQSHPRRPELLLLQGKLLWRSRMLGLEPWPDDAEVAAALEAEHGSDDPADLRTLAWQFVGPDKPVYGAESMAVLLAGQALVDGPEALEAEAHNTLAWAEFRVGRLDEADALMTLALEIGDASMQPMLQASATELTTSIAAWRGEPALSERRMEHAALAEQVAELERVTSERSSWDFADPDDLWWHSQLAQLVSDLRALNDPDTGLLGDTVAQPFGWGVKKRLEFAKTIRASSLDSVEARTLWGEAVAAIATSPMYAGQTLAPQLGLLPLGPDPASGLWEFAHLQTGEAARRAPDGTLASTPAMGIVFVLVPGGRFWMGAQRDDERGRNYDPRAEPPEAPVHEVTLSPFFISKFELTQGQWSRISADNPSEFDELRYLNDWNTRKQPWTGLHPVENVSWHECLALLGRIGLTLPGEAQWEYACRAGTTTVYWCGNSKTSLADVANISDLFGLRNGNRTTLRAEEWLNDGNTVHASVGSYAANAFGLHDVHGNLWEWCLDGFNQRPYQNMDAVDPVVVGKGAIPRVHRGGSHRDVADDTRSANRYASTPSARANDLGLRPVMKIVHE